MSKGTGSLSFRQRILRQARIFLLLGFLVVPIPPRQKGPRIKEWNKLRLEKDELDRFFGEQDNIGVILGKPSRGLVDVDCDAAEAIAIAPSFLPATERIHGRPSKPESHRWYLADPIPAAMQLADVDGAMLVELRSTGQQTLIPPSIHPSGEQFYWKLAGDPSRVDGGSLRRNVRLLGACALVARHWPEMGHRHECSKALAGTLLKAGFSEDEATTFLTQAAKASGRDEEWAARKADIVTTAKALSAGRPTTGIPRLKEILGPPVVDKLVDWLDLSPEQASVGQFSGLSPQRGLVQWPDPLSTAAFQGLPGEIVSVIAPESEADPAAILIQALISFGNVIGRKPFFKVAADRHFTNLFAVLVGDTSKARKVFLGRISRTCLSKRIQSGLPTAFSQDFRQEKVLFGQCTIRLFIENP